MEQPIEIWVSEGSSDKVSVKQRIHIILEAIAYDDDLSQVMVLKGGILMSMKFGNDRHTKDVDFSFINDFSQISDDPEGFIQEIHTSKIEMIGTIIITGFRMIFKCDYPPCFFSSFFQIFFQF